VVAVAGLAGLVSVLAAASVPGRSTVSTNASTGGDGQAVQQSQAAASQQDPLQQSSNFGQPQPPSSFGSGGGSPWAVSGGS
jgi:hypothetical protein